jgi:uncharacterized protein (DUF2235 family)
MRLVICADGTWSSPQAEGDGPRASTNVVKLASAVLPRDAGGQAQVVNYHAGVGEEGGLWSRLTGGAFGVGISRGILDLYLFLSNNYSPGDELFLFGFSRGAYTVRSLAGLVRNCGILRKENVGRCREAYALYRDRSSDTHPSSGRAKAFRATYAWPDFNIRFIGVWDTVGALGIPLFPLRFLTKPLYQFHDVELNSHVDHAYQALAIDEARRSFGPALWKKQADAPASQVLEQAWFPGVHQDVGGGCRATGLSNGALAWMWEKAQAAGLALDPLRKPASNPAGRIHDSLTLGFRVLGRSPRVLGTSNPQGKEGLAPFTRARLAAVPGYRPENLLDYLERTGEGLPEGEGAR